MTTSTPPQANAVDAALQVALQGVDGKEHSLSSLAGSSATVVIFVSNGCPTVRAYEERLKALQDTWRSAGVQVIAVNANNPFLSPPDTFEEMVQRSGRSGFNFPYLKDDRHVLAKAFAAICTPHAFVLDSKMNLAYSGRVDDSRVGNTITSRDLDNAVADVVAGRPLTVERTDPFGCSIVW